MNKTTYSLKFRMFLLISTLLLSQLVLVVVAMNKSKALLNNLQNVTNRELPATKYLTYADMMHDGIRAVTLEALYTHSKMQSDKLPEIQKEAQEKVDSFNDSLKKLSQIQLSKSTSKMLSETEIDVKDYSESCLKVISLLIKNDINGANKEHVAFDEHFEKLEKSLAALSAKIEKEAALSGDNGKDIVQSVFEYSAIGFVIALLSSIVIFAWTKKSFDILLEKVSEATNHISFFAKDLRDESNKVKESTVDQSAAIQESVSALSEMGSMIAQTADNVKLSLETSVVAQEKSTEGKQIMERMTHSMSSIQKANLQLQEIGKVIEDINSKTNIINDIVFKTQLLSFNASIEAARAGQHGRGFAVVAEEVGNLAELSGQAAKEIENLLSDSQKKVTDTLEMIQNRVNDGNKVSQQAMQAFLSISENINQISGQVHAINEATQQQEIGIQQSNSAMKQMDISSQSNTLSSTKTSEKAEQMNAESENLSKFVNELQLLVSGSSLKNFVSTKQNTIKENINEIENISKDNNDGISHLIQKLTQKKNQTQVSDTNEISADDEDFVKIEDKKSEVA